MSDEIERIAEGLSEAQRRNLQAMGTGRTMEDSMRHGLINFTLISEGLMTFRRKWWLFGDFVFYLTPLGKAVRTHLQEQSK